MKWPILTDPTELVIEPKIFVMVLLNSVILGLILTLVSYIVVCATEMDDEEILSLTAKRKLFLGASNILFMSVGLAGVMVLVNNNLARAFAIGAALSLCRFRVKISKKSSGTHLMFGIIAGMACGLNQLVVAWACTLVYVVLQLSLALYFKKQK